MEQEILKLLGKILVYGGGGAVVAYGIFKFMGEKWIENKFAERLEAFKHIQNKELEEVRYKIKTLFNRVTKIHEKEFEVLPASWMKLQNALGLISRLVSPLQENPNFNHMGEDELKEFLLKSRLTEVQRNRILNERDKNEYYINIIFWHDLHDAEKGISEFHNYIIRNKIFLSSDLQEKFKKIDDIIWDAYTMSKISKEADDRKMRHEAYKKIRDDVNPLRDKIEKLVQKRLHYQEN